MAKSRAANAKMNAEFLEQNPDFVPPPNAVLYDAYGTISYEHYMSTGSNEAERFYSLFTKHLGRQPTSVMEWGCGPARVLRHIPALMMQGGDAVGFDYNPDSIAWCDAALKGISFKINELAPPLPTDAQYDAIYAISVLTHLSQAQQAAWVAELTRCLKPDGVMILTTHGEQHSWALLEKEKKQLVDKGVVIRDGVTEGKRCYVSYHHPDYVRQELFNQLSICEHITSPDYQDIWILKHKGNM